MEENQGAQSRLVIRQASAPTITETVVRAALAAVPHVGGPLEVIFSDVRARQAVKAEELVGYIALEVGEGALAARLADDPRAEALFVNAVNAALKTGSAAKRQLLARVAAQALTDEATFDENELLVSTLEELESQHIAALARLEAEWVERLTTEAGVVNTGKSQEWQRVPEPVKAALIRVGAARATSLTQIALEGPRRADGITDYGLKVLERLRDENTEGERRSHTVSE